jgi:hypothetical protein
MLLGPEGSAVGWCLGAWVLVACRGVRVLGRRGLLFEFCIVDASIFVVCCCVGFVW